MVFGWKLADNEVKKNPKDFLLNIGFFFFESSLILVILRNRRNPFQRLQLFHIPIKKDLLKSMFLIF